MEYRRFGRTELSMPVLSCGGMRYNQAWQDLPFEEITAASQANVEATIAAALRHGINHIETARGYGSSEVQLGRVLPQLPRQELIVQTKVGPQEDAAAYRATFETCLARLRLDSVDLLGLHGLNTQAVYDLAVKAGGSLDAAESLRTEGRCHHVGFSTHAPLPVILQAIATGRFSYVNLHYYYFDQANAPAVAAAAAQDMGVFIISPSDKGGKLYQPPEKLVELCRPLSPMAFNDLWCLTRPGVQTISVGAARPEDFDAHLVAVERLADGDALVAEIDTRLQAEAERILGREWMAGWAVGLPLPDEVPGVVNLYQVLRLYTLAKAYDMVEFARMRYNLFGNGGHWFYGNKVDQIEWDRLPEVIASSPIADRIPDALREAHEMLNAENVKRLSQS
ncbi:MAG: aldo/keto reductase [Armatimonadetes bacterium]|nr:aldo/keto reductase [Armatimonadota bacterium]